MTGGAERIVRGTYRLALALAGPLLLAGLLADQAPLLRAGVLVVMVTPIVGLVIVAGAMVLARDWTFAGVALLVIAIVASSLYAAARMTPAVRPAASAEATGAP